MTEPELRKCNVCGVYLPLHSFPKDKTKKKKRGYTCRECHNEKRKIQPKTNDRERVNIQRVSVEPMMPDDVFMLYYENAELSDFIRTYAIRHSKKDRNFQEDLRQTAWMYIAMCASGKSNEYYKRVAKNAIYNEYRKKWQKRAYRLEDDELMSRSEYEMWKHGGVR